MKNVRDVAIEALCKLPLPPIMRLAMCKKYRIPKGFDTALQDICRRDKALTYDEASKLGLDLFVMIAAARQWAREAIRTDLAWQIQTYTF